MSRRGYNSNWQNASNPNMAPLPPRPRAGLGSAGYAPSPGSGPSPTSPGAPPSAGLPLAPGLPAAPLPTSIAPAEAATTLFVGSISPGINDTWLTKLLEACGSLRSLKRVSKAFGFAEFYEPDAVIRAIQVLNGRELPPMGVEGQSGQAKKLVVKADEKTKKFLEQYESKRVTTEADEKNHGDAASAVDSIIKDMKTSADTEDEVSKRPAYEVPAHLKDLPPEELPEEHRGSVLSEIEQFRMAAAAREEATRKRELELERQRAAERARRADQQQPHQSRPSPNGRGSEGPQSYQRPVPFVQSSRDAKPAAQLEPDELDELEERRRREEKDAHSRAAAAESERAYLAKERQRIAFWEKEMDKERRDKERTEKDAIALLRKWEDWRDSSASERELFYTDRKRWRHYRSHDRRKEEEADERDRKAEVEEAEQARKETERFLAQQAADMAALAEKQRAAGVLVPQEGGLSAPLKLNLTNAVKADASGDGGAAQAARVAKPTVLGDVDDDDLGKRASRIKQITFNDELTDTQRDEEKQAQFSKLEETVPSEPEALFKLQPKWEWVTESLVQGKYKKWADVEIEDSLGEQVEELVEFIVETLQAHKGADELISGIEPVLAEEAESFVAKLWRMVVVDSLAAAAGI